MERRRFIDEDIARFFRGSVVTFLGTTDAQHTPDVTRATAVAVAGDDRVRLLISSLASVAWANLARGGRVSVLVTDITSYRSLQWRGRPVEIGERSTPGDLALADRAMAAFEAGCPVVGLDPADAWHLWADELRPVVVEVDQVFDQTPGPAAGRAVSAGVDPA